MKLFYQHLAAGETVSEGVQGAKLDMIKEEGPMALPYYWAGFRLIGDGLERIAASRDGRNASPLLSHTHAVERTSEAAF
jgi:hypothetical protein